MKIKIFIGVILALVIICVGALWILQTNEAKNQEVAWKKYAMLGGILKESDARAIAQSACITGTGETLTSGSYNGVTKTWWFDAKVNSAKPGCNPVCIVSEETKTAEMNLRCEGGVPPDFASKMPQQISCLKKVGNEVCATNYEPVCAPVQVQCIKAPCPPIKETFGNSCEACKNTLVSTYTKGECVK
jgi:hypothetical protein